MNPKRKGTNMKNTKLIKKVKPLKKIVSHSDNTTKVESLSLKGGDGCVPIR